MLDAGIDVFSTVNVQHLESLNDQVAELTGVRVKETFPDQVLSAADEVVLVDLTPEALIAAPARGQGLSRGARAHGAEQLLPRGEPVGAARGGAAPGGRGRGGQAAGHAGGGARHPRGGAVRGGAAAGGGAGAGAGAPGRVRPAARAAGLAVGQRLAADLDLLYVAPPGSPPGEEREALESLRRLARYSAPSCSWRRTTTWPRPPPGWPRARHDLRADGPAARRGADRAAWRSRSPKAAPAAAGRGRADRGRPALSHSPG